MTACNTATWSRVRVGESKIVRQRLKEVECTWEKASSRVIAPCWNLIHANKYRNMAHRVVQACWNYSHHSLQMYIVQTRDLADEPIWKNTQKHQTNTKVKHNNIFKFNFKPFPQISIKSNISPNFAHRKKWTLDLQK